MEVGSSCKLGSCGEAAALGLPMFCAADHEPKADLPILQGMEVRPTVMPA